MNHLVTIFISKDIECCFGSIQTPNVNHLESVPLYGYLKKGKSNRGERTALQHILVVTGTRQAGVSSSLQPCTCSSHYQQLGEMKCTSTSTHTSRSASSPGFQAPQLKSHEYEVWIHVDMSVVGLLSCVVIDKTPVDLENVCLIFYSPHDIYQSDLLSLKYPYHYKADITDAQPVPFCIAKVQKQFMSQVQTKQTSKYVLFYGLKLAACVYQKVLSVPNMCMGLQSHLDRLFGYKSATLHQVSLRIDQLGEIQRLGNTFLDQHSRIVINSSQSDQSLQDQSFRNTTSAASSHFLREPHTSTHSKQCYSDTSNTESTESHSSSNICYSCYTTCGTASQTLDEKKSRKDDDYNKRNLNSSACLVLGRLVCVVVVDLALGALLLLWLLSVVSVDGLFAKFGEITQGVSDGVLRLLSWLRGAPAGLKLNQPLARALATFFSYHVGLWMLYLEVASSAVYGLCWGLVWSGVLGASVQVALLADMLHLATLHLHCIYIYAARLHMVQVSLFGSQWRAFRGHKWNPLKQRVDSLHPPAPVVLSTPNNKHVETSPRAASHVYNIRQSLRGCEEKRGDGGNTQQASAGSAGVRTASTTEARQRSGSAAATKSASVPSTLTVLPECARATSSSKPLSRVLSAVIFTLVVFLLPTTTVFYLVFVSLRLVLFMLRSVLSALAWLLHHNPLYLVLLTLCRSSKLKGDIYFERLHQESAEGSSGPLLLALTVRPSGLLASLRQYAASDVLPSLAAPDMGNLIQTVIYARQLL